MWKSKKVIIAVLLVVAMLVGSTAGVVLAQSGTEGESQPKTLLSRVAEILDIDQQALEDAFARARGEMHDEAVDRFLQRAVEQGKMTQEEADQYNEWWQARPETMLPRPFQRFEAKGFRGGMEWGAKLGMERVPIEIPD